MKFDILASFADSEFTSIKGTALLRHAVQSAALLQVPKIDPGSTPEPELLNNFRLPWQAAVFEDSVSAVLLMRMGRVPFSERGLADSAACTDRVTPARKGTAPLGNIAVNARSSTKDIGIEVGDTLLVMIADSTDQWDAVMIGVLSAGNVAQNRVNWLVHHVEFYRKNKDGWQRARPAVGDEKSLVTEITSQTMCAIEQACNVTRPSNWILKRQLTPAEQKVRDKHQGKKTPRSHERDRWLLITDKERVRYFREPVEAETVPASTGHHASPVPHPRRAHYRHIGQNEDGTRKHTWVRACWVGSTEATIRGNRYKVELEL